MPNSQSTPRFAVVGHPNKGKSSIVAALAQNDAIAISQRSGTTTQAERYDVQVGDGAASYALIDTPGFQRPSKVLAWLKDQAPSADQRRAAVEKFLRSEDCAAQFPDETALLRPIMDGAAILYVVDGSRPYNPDYEAEMEILRWTGQASMALINPIESNSEVEAWQQALGQYFKIVRLFNPFLADRLRRDEILEAFAIIAPQWREPLEGVRSAYTQQEVLRLQSAAALLSDTLLKLCTHRCTTQTTSKSAAEAARPSLEARYFAEMRELEGAAHGRLKELYSYHKLDSQSAALPLDGDLFDTEKWIAWGLTRRQLTAAAGLAGASTGAVIDAAMAGSSLLLGALSGGMLAGAATWIAADTIAKFQFDRSKDSALGAYEAAFGPSSNANFPYVVTGRFLALLDTLRNRTHAQRDTALVPTIDLKNRLDELTSTERLALAKLLQGLAKQRIGDDSSAILLPLLKDESKT